jgi:hypothetical protein
MASIGEWIQQKILDIPSSSAGAGFLLLIFALLASTVLDVVAAFGMPARKSAVDSLRAEVAEVRLVQDSANRIVIQHITDEERERTSRDCVLNAFWEFITDEDRNPINPNRCAGGNQ